MSSGCRRYLWESEVAMHNATQRWRVSNWGGLHPPGLVGLTWPRVDVLDPVRLPLMDAVRRRVWAETHR
jgi:hypothetical protein